MSDHRLHFPCVSCGAQLAYQPGTTELVCGACGTAQPVPVANGRIDEHDLDRALAQAPRVDPTTLREGGSEVQCEGCGAIAMVENAADRCAFCDAPVVVLTEHEALIPPESVLPFGIEKKEAAERFKAWLSGLWFAPNDLVQRARQEAIDGVYLPYWTFDARSDAAYQGERGDDYYETETRTNAEGEEVEHRVRKTNWTSVSGRVDRHFDDVLVCATTSLPRSLTERLEPWDLDALAPFTPAFLAGFTAERYSLSLEDGWGTAQERMRDQLRRDVEADIGGDRQRIGSMQVRHADTTFKHTLLPLWISAYRYQDEVYRVIVNARTGAVSGDRPYSRTKIAIAVFLVLLVAFFICGGFSCCGSTVAVVEGR